MLIFYVTTNFAWTKTVIFSYAPYYSTCLKENKGTIPKFLPARFPSAENVSCETRVCQRVRCFTWNIDRPEKVSRETVPPCFAPMFHVEQFRHLFHAFVSHETKVPSLRMAPQSVDKVCFHAKTAVARQRAFKSVCCANAWKPGACTSVFIL